MRLTDIPIKTIVRPSRVKSGFYVAKSALSFSNWNGNQVILGGYSYGRNKEKCSLISKFEVQERLFAHYDFHLGKQKFTGVNLQDIEKEKDFEPSKILIGELPRINGVIESSSASGLSFNFELNKSIKSSVHEIVERHLLCEAWFQKRIKIYLLKQYTNVIEDFALKIYTVPYIPLCISFIHSPTKKIIFSGSSFSHSRLFSAIKSSYEAMMLLDSYIENENQYCHSPATKERLNNLNERDFYPYIMDRINDISYLNYKNIHSNQNCYHEFMNKLRDHIYIIPIVSMSNINVMRAYSDFLLSLKRCRADFSEAIRYDPFF